MRAKTTAETAMPVSEVSARSLVVVSALFLAQACLGSGSSSRDGGAGFAGLGGGGSGAGGFSGIGGSGGFPFDAGMSFDGGGSFCSFCPSAPPSSGSGFLMPCCTELGGCGLSSNGLLFRGCLDLRDPGIVDVACPLVSATIGGIQLAGCCTREGMCGVSLSALGLGCVERADVIGSIVVPIQEPVDIACGWQGLDAGVPSDAGHEDDAGEMQCTSDERAVCDPAAICRVYVGSARCACDAGYVDLSPPNQAGIRCRDINECLVSGACDEGVCVNTPGAFRCDLDAP